MKSFARAIAAHLLLLLPFASVHAAQPELTGVWQGKLAVDAKTSLTIQFTFTKQPDGRYAAVLNSPDNIAIKNTPASAVSWDGTRINMQVAALSGTYAGELKNGRISGQWTQPGGVLPLELSPYQRPVLTKAAIDTLTGSWSGSIEVAGSPTNLVFQFKPDDKGELQGTFGIPDQGLTDVPVSDIEFANGAMSVRIPRLQAQYTGAFANGAFSGNLKIPSPAIPQTGAPLTLKRGEYKAPVHALKLSTEEFAALNGKWQGRLEATSPQGQKVSLNVAMRFETNRNGQYVGFLDSPDQKAMGIAMTAASLANGKLTVKVDAVKGEYTGTLSGKTLTGQWTQPGVNSPLTLTQ